MLILMNVLKRVLVVSISIVISIPLGACGVAAPMPTVTAPTYTLTAQYLSTPELIDQALAKGEITEDERFLYLAYALYEYKSLPTQYLSKAEWFGDVVAEELDEVVSAQAKLCSMSPYVRSELLRLIKKTDDTVCN